MASADGSDPMMVGSDGSNRRHLGKEECGCGSEPKCGLDTVRAKQYVKISRRLYLVVIECRCKVRPNDK